MLPAEKIAVFNYVRRPPTVCALGLFGAFHRWADRDLEVIPSERRSNRFGADRAAFEREGPAVKTFSHDGEYVSSSSSCCGGS
jgi:hypothetical protein